MRENKKPTEYSRLFVEFKESEPKSFADQQWKEVFMFIELIGF